MFECCCCCWWRCLWLNSNDVTRCPRCNDVSRCPCWPTVGVSTLPRRSPVAGRRRRRRAGLERQHRRRRHFGRRRKVFHAHHVTERLRSQSLNHSITHCPVPCCAIHAIHSLNVSVSASDARSRHSARDWICSFVHNDNATVAGAMSSCL